MKTITLTQGKVALVDDGLFEELSQFKWQALKGSKTWYAQRHICVDGRQTTIMMHREIFRLKGQPLPKLVDHRDRDGLNNRWSNLRPANHIESIRNRGKRRDNTSDYIGVSPARKKWQARVKVGGVTKNLGYFTDKFSAAWIRDEFVKANFGEFAVTNNLVDRRVRPLALL